MLHSYFVWSFAHLIDWPLKEEEGEIYGHLYTSISGYTAHQLLVAKIIQMPNTILNINIHPQLSTTL